MNKQDSAKTVFLALSVNFFIGLIKSFVAIFTSSSAMFSEAVHSFVDSFNQFLLWFGIKQAKKDKPLIYPLGRGREEYFWTLVVAVSITILSISIILESYVLVKAVAKLRKDEKSKKKAILKLLKESNDGPLIAIVVEDFAATLGLIIALIGTLLTYITTNSIYDAASSIMIGLLLMVSGLFLGYEMKHLITGETVDPNIYKNINSEIDSFDDILEIIDTKIISIGSNKYLALIKVNYEDTLTDPEIIDLNQSIEAKIKNVDSRFSHLYIIPA